MVVLMADLTVEMMADLMASKVVVLVAKMDVRTDDLLVLSHQL